ncbi:Hypothetical predicted protein [Mytilus galloprovincialis]|uniref:Apple domain-containing protein n=1 Tax=Mytilus galloprovincialis TaxID=29158 RepID=A0A8B6EN02_MYTGA|nr:Hypothetical predicted protein [Mytilus galloprovincialis]
MRNKGLRRKEINVLNRCTRCTLYYDGQVESPLSVLPVEEQMTWRRGYEYCKSLSRRLVYVSPSVRADFQYMYEDINCGCNITFWTAHQVSNHTVVKAQRYYDTFPLDNIKEDSSLLLCVFLVYESVNKIIGWEADECNDSNARHGLVCDIVFPEDKKIMTLYIANLTWTDANDFCEERNSSLMLENGPFTYGELDYLLVKGYWSNTRINSFWTYHRTSNYVSTVSLLPINSSSYNADIGGSYCAYVVIERPLEPNKLTWMSDFCLNSSRSFICESESEEFYYTQFENVRPVGQGLNIVFEVRLTSLADCLLKCNESTENGIPCELFVWNKLNSTCQLLNIEQAALPFNDSKCCYWDETSKQYEMHVAEGCTTYDRFIYTPRIVEDYPSGDEITTLENDGPLSTTINAKLTEALSLLQSSRTMPVHREYWCDQCTVF